ncbi:hypothetical protein GQ53DRAFT_824492 [Thozetella sp. PMI_491]|nr:hypothetical protein GQ53DRAFT_824492 [Thozetella sp. PMI_491]
MEPNQVHQHEPRHPTGMQSPTGNPAEHYRPDSTQIFASEPYSNGAYYDSSYHNGNYTNLSMEPGYPQNMPGQVPYTGQAGPYSPDPASKEPYVAQAAYSQPSRATTAKPLHWPHEPRLLQRSRLRTGDLFINLFSLLVVVLLVVYIVFLVVFDDTIVDSAVQASHFLREISQLGPTVVPLLFAFIVGRAIRTWAHWRLQQGEQIGRLDLFYGSTTVTGTLSTMLELRRFGTLEILLAITWAFSPLGGQAILRVLSFEQGGVPSPITLPVLNMSTTFPTSLTGGDNGGYSIPVETLILTSLGAPADVRGADQDTWGNLKVPLVESLAEYKGMENKDWIQLNDRAVNYSSLIGIPLGNIDATRNSTFNLETSYMRMTCPEVRSSGAVTTLLNQMGSTNGTAGCAPTGCRASLQWGSIAALDRQQGRNAGARCADPSGMDARVFQYFSFDSDPSQSNGTFANCTMTTSYVELAVQCAGVSCKTVSIRPSTLQTNPSANYTMFDYCPGEGNFPFVFPYFIRLLGSFAWGTQSSGQPSALQMGMLEPDQALNATARVYMPALYTLGPEAFSMRLTQVLNNYWLASVATEALFLGHPANYENLSNVTGSAILFKDVEGTGVTPVTVVHCNRGWLAPLVLSTAAMFVAAVCSLLLDGRISVPRIMMNMSTMTRGNPNFGLPDGAGALSDEERARLLRNMRVRFGESVAAPAQGEVGSLAIGDCAEDGGRVAPYRRDRYYL